MNTNGECCRLGSLNGGQLFVPRRRRASEAMSSMYDPVLLGSSLLM